MILSDRDILRQLDQGSLVITTENNEDVRSQVHASSVDLRLGNTFKVYRHAHIPYIDPKNLNAQLTEIITASPDAPFFIQPGEFILGVTAEKVKIPNDLVARVEGRSSLGRLGLIIHATAGFIDAGFEGTITLEIGNINKLPIALYPGQRICQLAFEQMTSEALVPYGEKPGAKYQHQVLPEESRISLDNEWKHA